MTKATVSQERTAAEGLGEVRRAGVAGEGGPRSFSAPPPLDITEEEFRRLIGYAKYRAHLNYLYGVVVEEVLQLVVEEDLRKDQLSRAWEKNLPPDAEAFEHIYGRGQDELLREFRDERRLPEAEGLSLAEAQGVPYGLFN